MEEQKQIKIYVRTFKFSDGSMHSVETEDGAKMTQDYRPRWAREHFKKEKIIETIDSVKYERI